MMVREIGRGAWKDNTEMRDNQQRQGKRDNKTRRTKKTIVKRRPAAMRTAKRNNQPASGRVVRHTCSRCDNGRHADERYEETVSAGLAG